MDRSTPLFMCQQLQEGQRRRRPSTESEIEETCCSKKKKKKKKRKKSFSSWRCLFGDDVVFRCNLVREKVKEGRKALSLSLFFFFGALVRFFLKKVLFFLCRFVSHWLQLFMESLISLDVTHFLTFFFFFQKARSWLCHMPTRC